MAGLSATAVHDRLRAGRLHRIHRGVYAVGHNGLTDHGRWKAATLAVNNSVLSHRSAAELWQLLRPTHGLPQITVPYPASPGRRRGIRIFRSRTLAAARTTMRNGIPLTMPARTLADLATVATAADVRRATREAESKGLPLTYDHVSTRTDSDLEDDFFALCARYGVPLPEKRAHIGRYRVDFLWRRERLIAEVDGYLYHRGRPAFRDDRERDVWLELQGFAVVRFDDTRIEEDPAGIASDVLGLLANRAP
jgi:predicted transcriptional regulator of viral defense system